MQTHTKKGEFIKMRCYVFYSIPEKKYQKIDRRYLKDQYPIYAITNKKKLAKMFKKQRKKKKYLCDIQNMDKEEYSVFANRHRSCVLEKQSLLTVIKKYTKEEKQFYVTIAMTADEMNEMDDPVVSAFFNDDEYWLSLDTMITDQSYFKEKYRKVLKYLDYTDMYKLSTGYFLGDLSDEDDYSAPDFSVDELQLFTDYFLK